MPFDRMGSELPLLPQDRRIIAFYSYKGGVGRTMALCNVAAFIAARAKARGGGENCVLVVDFDLEAPGVHSLFVPESPEPKLRGLLGLLLDHREWAANGQDTKIRIADALTNARGGYTYRAKGIENLIVLPTGALNEKERARALRILSDTLHPLASDRSSSRLPSRKGHGGFFAELRLAMRASFLYSFVDSRTGLADEAFATTALLCETLVTLFRPSATELVAVQRVVAGFMAERSLTVASSDIPVIPVISPRPLVADERLTQFRTVAMEHVFPWLQSEEREQSEADFFAPSAGEMIELPFDFALQMGDQLLIAPPAQGTQPRDSESPLGRAYVRLAKQIQKGNARNDIDGARAMELELYELGDYSAALHYMLAVLSKSPDSASIWSNLFRRYKDYISRDPDARRLVLELCDNIWDQHTDIPFSKGRAYASLARVEVLSSTSPVHAWEELVRLWRHAQEIAEVGVLRPVLTAVSKLLRAVDEDTIASASLPSDEMVARMMTQLASVTPLRSLRIWRAALAREGAFRRSARLYESLGRNLRDQLVLTSHELTRATIADQLAQIHFQSGDFSQGAAWLRAAAELPGASPRVRWHYLDILLRLRGDKQDIDSALRLSSPEWRPYHEALCLLRMGAETEALALRFSPAPSRALSDSLWARIIVVSHLHHRNYRGVREALAMAPEHFAFTAEGTAIAAIAAWLESDREPPEWTARRFRSPSKVRIDTEAVFLTADAICCLVWNPESCAEVANQRLDRGEWLPLSELRWLLLLSASSTLGGDTAVSRIDCLLRKHPALAAYARTDEWYVVLRHVCEKLALLRKENTLPLTRALASIDQTVTPDLQAVSVEDLPIVSLDDDSPSLDSIVSRWKVEDEHTRLIAQADDEVDKLVAIAQLAEDQARSELSLRLTAETKFRARKTPRQLDALEHVTLAPSANVVLPEEQID